MEEKQNSVDEAKKLIEADKKERAEKFRQELDELCKKYNCDLAVSGIIIQPL